MASSLETARHQEMSIPQKAVIARSLPMAGHIIDRTRSLSHEVKVIVQKAGLGIRSVVITLTSAFSNGDLPALHR